MLIKGQLFATSDMDIVDTAAKQGFKLIYVGDQFEMPTGYNFVNAIGLTPDYITMTAVVEGNTEKFTQSYINMLSTPATEEMIAVIIGALKNGANIMIYFPHDTLQLEYPYIFLQYLQDRFGIIVGAKENQFMYNQAFDAANARLLYIYRIIPWNEYLLMTDDVDPVTIIRFKEDLSQQFNIPADIKDEDMVLKLQQIKDQMTSPKKRLFVSTKQ